MRKYIKACTFSAMLLSPILVCSADEIELTQQLNESRNIAQEFTTKLGGILKNQIETAGLESAITVCKTIAPQLAAEYSNDTRVVKRVSIKNRNPLLGVPDGWEKSMLIAFDEEQQKGEQVAIMEKHAIEKDVQGTWFRYAKAIPTQPLCLQCHGQQSDIKPNIKALLQKEYPNDKAVGYSLGMIRGAVSIKQKIESPK